MCGSRRSSRSARSLATPPPRPSSGRATPTTRGCEQLRRGSDRAHPHLHPSEPRDPDALAVEEPVDRTARVGHADLLEKHAVVDELLHGAGGDPSTAGPDKPRAAVRAAAWTRTSSRTSFGTCARDRYVGAQVRTCSATFVATSTAPPPPSKDTRAPARGAPPAAVHFSKETERPGQRATRPSVTCSPDAQDSSSSADATDPSPVGRRRSSAASAPGWAAARSATTCARSLSRLLSATTAPSHSSETNTPAAAATMPVPLATARLSTPAPAPARAPAARRRPGRRVRSRLARSRSNGSSASTQACTTLSAHGPSAVRAH